MKQTLLTETTEISPIRTVAEITACLVNAGATQIMSDYRDGEVAGLKWVMNVPKQGLRLFDMPARIEPVYQILISRRRDRHKLDVQMSVRDQAKRVAWRQLLRWVQAQIAMAQTGMVDFAEVFFPYLQLNSGATIYAAFRENGQRLLAGPENPQ